jgi:hypothetical protein
MGTLSQRASDVRIDFIELLTPAGTYDLTNFLISFNMYESIYEECVRIEIVINDSVNLPYYAPILGEEQLNMIFSTQSVERGEQEINPGQMYSVSITDRHIVKDRQNVYILHFVSQQGLCSMNSTVSRSYQGKTISQIVFDIYDEYLDNDDSGNELIIEPTKGIENIVIPNWKPFDAINWLSKRALNSNDVPNYLFWESNGNTYFQSVDTLMKQEVIQKFVYNPLSNDTTKLVAAKNNAMEIDNMEIISQFNITHNIENGLYASKMITHDIVKKKITERTHSLDDIYDGRINHTDEYMPISRIETDYAINDRHTFAPLDTNHSNQGDNIQSYYDSKIIVWPKHNKMFSQTPTEEYDNNVEDWLLQRNALIHSLNQIKVVITTPGMSFLRSGQKVELTVPSPEKVVKTGDGKITNKESLKDYYLSGEYIITAINHDVNFLGAESGNRYRNTMELTKDALGSAPGKTGKIEK